MTHSTNRKLKYFFRKHFYFIGNLHDQKQKGLDVSTSHRPVSKEHTEQICKDYFIANYDNDPTCLMHKVYFDIAYFWVNMALKA